MQSSVNKRSNNPARRHVLYELINSGGSAATHGIDLTLTTPPSMATQQDEEHGDYGQDDCILDYNIAFLGTGKVGKTSILRQFIHLDFDDAYIPSTACTKYRKAVYVGGRIYDMTLRDCPAVSYFPADSLAEWSVYKGYGLHTSQVSLHARWKPHQSAPIDDKFQTYVCGKRRAPSAL